MYGDRGSTSRMKRRKAEEKPNLPKVATQGIDELELVVARYKSRFVSQCGLSCLSAVLWPVLLFFTPLFFVGRSTKDAAHRILLIVTVGALSICYFGPLLMIVAMRGPQYFIDLVRFGQVELVEVASYCVCFIILLVLLCYAWVLFESIQIEVKMSLMARNRFLNQYWREALDLTEKEQVEVFGDDKPKYISDLIVVLHRLPGWRGNFEVSVEELDKIARGQDDRNAGSPMRAGSGEGTTPRGTDVKAQLQVAQDDTGFSTRDVGAISAKVWLFLQWLLSPAQPPPAEEDGKDEDGKKKKKPPAQGRADICVLVVFGFLRASVPRAWVHYTHGAPLMPHDSVDALFVVVLFLGTFCVAALCFILLERTRAEYAHNVDQMLLVSALASVEARHQYLHDVLGPYLQRTEGVGLESERGRKAAARLPFLDLTKSANLRIWWALREFAIVDSMDERVALEVVLSMALLYQFAIITYSILELFVAGGVTAFTAVVLFDLTAIGAMVMLGTLSCVQVNNMLSSHQSTLLRSRMNIWSPESKIVGLSVDEQLEFVTHDEATTLEELESQENTLRLHNHLILKIRTADNLQKLFGIEVTTDNVIQLAAAIGCGIAASARYFTK